MKVIVGLLGVSILLLTQPLLLLLLLLSWPSFVPSQRLQNVCINFIGLLNKPRTIVDPLRR